VWHQQEDADPQTQIPHQGDRGRGSDAERHESRKGISSSAPHRQAADDEDEQAEAADEEPRRDEGP